MNNLPRWYVPVAVVALIWNLVGCVAYLSDVMLTPADIAQMDPSMQVLYSSRPAWSVAATAVAVWFGALGCVGLILRKRWSLVLLVLSLIGVILQDIHLFFMVEAAAAVGPVLYVFQGLVLLVSIGLVLLSRRGIQQEWLS